MSPGQPCAGGNVAVSVVLYKTDRRQLAACIQSVLESPLAGRLTLVDNSPTDGLRSFVESMPGADGRVEYRFNPSNPGYGAAHNRALSRSVDALKSGDECWRYHLVVNPDVRFEPGTLEGLAAYMDARPDVGLVMPKVVYPDGSVQRLCKLLPSPLELLARVVPERLRGLFDRRNVLDLPFWDYDREMDIPWLSGCFMFLRTATVKAVGGFDERFFMYGEDIDFSRRINAATRTMFYPGVSVVHEHEAASKKSLRMLLVHAVNVARYFNKWGWLFDARRREINRETMRRLSAAGVTGAKP